MGEERDGIVGVGARVQERGTRGFKNCGFFLSKNCGFCIKWSKFQNILSQIIVRPF